MLRQTSPTDGKPFNAAASLQLDDIIQQLDEPLPRWERAWLRLAKRMLEARYVPAFYVEGRS